MVFIRAYSRLDSTWAASGWLHWGGVCPSMLIAVVRVRCHSIRIRCFAIRCFAIRLRVTCLRLGVTALALLCVDVHQLFSRAGQIVVVESEVADNMS